MNALFVLYAGNMASQAFTPLFNGKNSVSLVLERVKKIPGIEKIVLLTADGDFSGLGVQIEKNEKWNARGVLEKTAELSAGFDLVFFSWADTPFLDTDLAWDIAKRHIEYAAEYSYADGWPYGLAPEILSPAAAGILAKLAGEGPVGRDMLFSVIQKDINSFDIETEISPVDYRQHRLSLCADSKRNLLLLERFISAFGAIPSASDVGDIISKKPEILRTLPNFYPVQVYGGCPQSCAFCPYPLSQAAPVTGRSDFLKAEQFISLLDKIIEFSGDAVIDLSLWGELSLHPEKMEMISAVISRPELSLVIETSGVGWQAAELEKTAELSHNAPAGRISDLPPLSWIVSLDSASPQRYMEIRGQGFAEASACAKKLFSLFPESSYVQAVRTQGAEDDIEKFYRSWKEAAPAASNVIIQKYDDFCGALEKRQASDISPVIRQPCWHIMRDMPVLIDGTVPLCREDIGVLKNLSGAVSGRVLGNVFSDTLREIWERGGSYYTEQCQKKYLGLCAGCDEYYTYNF